MGEDRLSVQEWGGGDWGRVMNADPKPLLIKRYTSRRLYNTETSDYITLQDVTDQIRAGRDVKIVDLKTGDDLTRQYLIQIIADLEARGEQVLPLNILTEVVRTYNDQAREIMPQFLDAFFGFCKENQAQAMESFKVFANPLASYEEIGKNQRAMFSSLLNGWSRESGSQTKNDSSDEESQVDVRQEIDDLRNMVAELKSMVAKS